MKSRFLTLSLALVAGGIAVLLIAMYIQQIERESAEGQKTRSVLVTSRSIPAGTPGAKIINLNAFTVQEVPLAFIAPGAFTDQEQLEGLTLAQDITAGEQLTSVRFAASETDAFLAKFPKNTEALSLPLDFVRTVSGHIKAGDFVNAFVTGEQGQIKLDIKVRTDPSGLPSAAKISGKQGDQTFLLLDDVPIMEVNPAPADGETSGSANDGTFTVAVTSKEAAALINAQETAKLWFTLVPRER